jgi:hypothetical protein
MGCKNSKTVKVHNHVFDLIDGDGDNKMSNEELELVSNYLHRYKVNCSAIAHKKLEATPPVTYFYEVVDKKPGSKLVRKDFNKIAYMIPRDKWERELLPILRRHEIERLRDLK